MRMTKTSTASTSDSIANSCPARTNALKCYSCGERGHIQTACPHKTKRGLIVQEQEDSEPRYDDYDAPDDDNELIEGDIGLSLVFRRNSLLTKASQESWLRTNLFRSTCTINGRACKLIIDSGSCTNVMSHGAAQKLGLTVTPHHHLTRLLGLTMELKSTCQSKFLSLSPSVITKTQSRVM